jgi:phosphoribosylformylglycinamidine synthase
VEGTRQGIALTVDGNGRYCYLDPYMGGAIAVAEACRNLACVGAEAIALTDCLNFGDPQRAEVYYQLEECINGMAAACRALGVPIVSGNVSLYNETEGRAVYPTPVVGAVGLLEDVTRHCTAAFRMPGHLVLLLGAAEVRGVASTLGGSEFSELFHGQVAGRPALDLALEERVQRLCRKGVAQGLLSSAHDCADGGLAVALAECCLGGGPGLEVTASLSGRWDAALFGEAQSRIVVSVAPELLPALERLASAEDVPYIILGRVGGDHLVLPGLLDVPLEEMQDAWGGGLERAVR